MCIRTGPSTNTVPAPAPKGYDRNQMRILADEGRMCLSQCVRITRAQVQPNLTCQPALTSQPGQTERAAVVFCRVRVRGLCDLLVSTNRGFRSFVKRTDGGPGIGHRKGAVWKKQKSVCWIANQKRTVRHICAEHFTPAQFRGRRGTKRLGQRHTHTGRQGAGGRGLHKPTRAQQPLPAEPPAPCRKDRTISPSVLRDFALERPTAGPFFFRQWLVFVSLRATAPPPRTHTSFSLVGSSGQ